MRYIKIQIAYLWTGWKKRNTNFSNIRSSKHKLCFYKSIFHIIYKASEPMICSLWLTYIRDMNFTEDLFI